MPKPVRHVLVCTNSRPPGNKKGSCAEIGIRPLYERMKSLAKERGIEGVIINRTSCLKHCSRGVTVAVYPENVWYGGVTDADVDEIVTKHLQEGEPVARLFMPDIPWE